MLLETPLLGPGRTAVLGIGAVVRRPVVMPSHGGEAIVVRAMSHLSLSYDAGMLRGADAARFLGSVRRVLEEATRDDVGRRRAPCPRRRAHRAVGRRRWLSADGSRTLPVHDPSTGEVLAEVADASPADGVRALDAAVAHQDSFADMPPRDRGEILRRGFELMRERADDLALLMTLEMGKPLAESRAEVTYAAEFLRWFSEEAVRIAGRYSTSPDGATRLLTLKRPVGPTLMITPWNFPLAMGTRKVGPAVAAGCTMVVKPAAQTPLSMLAFAALMQEAGLPDGVLNVVTTSSSGQVMEPLVRDARHAQAHLHRLDRRGSTPRRAVGPAPAARVDGARRQCAVPRARRRRPRRCC